jgi:predicted DsbA family dithiol-disulfide isomerase
VKIEVWSDVVCPWCYIGKRRLETALSRFPHADQVEVIWRSFELDPGIPADRTEPTLPRLARKYGGSEEQMRGMMGHVEELAAAEGLSYDLPNGVSGNTLRAHQLIHLAAAHGRAGDMKERLLHAHFEERTSVFDVDALVALAVEIGLDGDEARAALADGRYLPAVHAANLRIANEPEKRFLVRDHNALERQPARGGDQGSGDAGQVVDLAGDQSRGLHGAGHLNHIDIQAMLLVDACIFRDEKRQKGKAECRITDAHLFQFLGISRRA